MEEGYEEEVMEEMDMEDRLLARLDTQIEKEIGGVAEELAMSISNSVFDLPIEERATAVKNAKARAPSAAHPAKKKQQQTTKKVPVSASTVGKSPSPARQQKGKVKKMTTTTTKKVQVRTPVPKPAQGKKTPLGKKVGRLPAPALALADSSETGYPGMADEDLEYSPVIKKKRKRKPTNDEEEKTTTTTTTKKTMGGGKKKHPLDYPSQSLDGSTPPASKKPRKKPTTKDAGVAAGGTKRKRPAGNAPAAPLGTKAPKLSPIAAARKKNLADLFGDSDGDVGEEDGEGSEGGEGEEEEEDNDDEVIELQENDDEDEDEIPVELVDDDDDDAPEEGDDENDESLFALFKNYLMLIAMHHKAIEVHDMIARGVNVPVPEGPGFAKADAAVIDYMRTQKTTVGDFIGLYLDDADLPNKNLGSLLKQLGRVVGWSSKDCRVGKFECFISEEDINAAEVVEIKIYMRWLHKPTLVWKTQTIERFMSRKWATLLHAIIFIKSIVNVLSKCIDGRLGAAFSSVAHERGAAVYSDEEFCTFVFERVKDAFKTIRDHAADSGVPRVNSEWFA